MNTLRDHAARIVVLERIVAELNQVVADLLLDTPVKRGPGRPRKVEHGHPGSN